MDISGYIRMHEDIQGYIGVYIGINRMYILFEAYNNINTTRAYIYIYIYMDIDI